jgi:tetratricopeptide (TPR) repeat protein
MPEQLKLFSPAIIAIGRGMQKMKRLDFVGAQKEFQQALISHELMDIAQCWKQAAEYWLKGLREIEQLPGPGAQANKWYELWDSFIKQNLPWRDQILAEMRQQVFRQIIELWQTEPTPLPYPIGYFQLESGDLEGAILSLEAELQNNPRNPLIQFLLANTYYSQGKLNKASRYYCEALLEKPLRDFEFELKNQDLERLWEEFADEGLDDCWFPAYATLRGIFPLSPITTHEQAKEIEDKLLAGETTETNKSQVFLGYMQLAQWYRKQGTNREIEFRRKMKSLNPYLFQLYLKRI